MLNGERYALRPALTAIDRQRYRDHLPHSDDPTVFDRGDRLLRADLIEDKQRASVIGSACVLRRDRDNSALLRLHAMSDSDSVRAELLQMLRAALPGVRDVDTIDSERIGLDAQASTTRASLGAQLSQALGIPEDYSSRHRLGWIDEPDRLHYAGRDYVGRTLWLQHGAMQAWHAMQRAALEAGLRLEAVSGFRSIGYQAGILRRKLDRGMSINDVLAINTAPGYSEHHSGRAIDIGTPGCAPAEEIFETTPAFAWLRLHAPRFGFRMSYPRDNPHGVIYEPWHWYWLG